MDREELIVYVRDRFSVDPDYPFEEDTTFVLRHRENKKWYAVAMTVPYLRLGIEKDRDVNIVDVKCGPLMMGTYRRYPGILPGYHMNKDNWITILLDGTAEEELIKELLEVRYELTKTYHKGTNKKRYVRWLSQTESGAEGN